LIKMSTAMMVDMNALRGWIAANPSRDRTLPQRSTFRKGNETAEQLSLNVPGGGENWITLSVQPAGPLSAMLMLLDEEYAAAPPNLRQKIMMERVLEYQDGLDNLKHVRRFARNMKRVRELFGADPSRLDDTGRALLWDALCTMKGIQTIVFSEAKGTKSGPQIAFSPADPRIWESGRPIFAVDEGLTRVFKPLRTAVAKQLGNWLGEREAAGVPCPDCNPKRRTPTEALMTDDQFLAALRSAATQQRSRRRRMRWRWRRLRAAAASSAHARPQLRRLAQHRRAWC
jgi:hypothetical protein